MKKLFLAALLLMTATGAFAQFEEGKKYVGASLTGLNLSYDDTQKFHFGVDATAGYFLFDDVMVAGQLGLNYGYESWQEFSAALKGKYYIEQNGITLGAGLKYTHLFNSYNDLAFTPEIGYCYFLNHYITVEPAMYYDMSLTDFSHHSKFGVRVGIGIYF